MGLYKIRSLWVLWVHIELYQHCADSERRIVDNLSVVPCGLQKATPRSSENHPKMEHKSPGAGCGNSCRFVLLDASRNSDRGGLRRSRRLVEATFGVNEDLKTNHDFYWPHQESYESMFV